MNYQLHRRYGHRFHTHTFTTLQLGILMGQLTTSCVSTVSAAVVGNQKRLETKGWKKSFYSNLLQFVLLRIW